MEDTIKKLETPEECMKLVEIFDELSKKAHQRAIELRAMSHGDIDVVEKELLQALYAYEEVLTKKNNRRTRANRTWQMVNRHGIIGAAEKAVNRDIEPQGYRFLVEMGLQDLTFEAVIVRHPESFDPEAVSISKQRLKQLDELK